jgi:uncharacterized repeat protein (TIGR02543 family)
MSALAILLFSCPDDLQVQEQQDKATVSFHVTDGTARTVLPQVSLADVAFYKLLGGLNGAAETEIAEFTTVGTSDSLEPGTWNFTLNAYNSAYDLILQDSVANKQINLTGTNQVTFSMSVMNSGMGAIEITLNFPESAGITQIKTNGDTGSENFTLTNSGTFVYTKDGIAAGDKLIHFELYRGDFLRTVVSELVLVRSNLTSSTTITLVGDNLKPLPTVEFAINLTAMNEWELTEQTALATANVNKSFTVTGTYSTYRWYLDGTQVGTSSSYTFSKPVGVYQLVVVATNSSGASRSGRCRVTVAPTLPANVWADDGITDANGEDWYSFPVSSGTTYRIWWNDSKQGNSTKSGDVAVSARYENATTFIFGGTDTTVDSGYTTAQSFAANQTGRVYIRVIPYDRNSSNTGTYGIMYSSTITTRPAIYTVTFNVNSGSGTEPARTVTAGSSVILPDGRGLSRSGYTFGGWNTNSSGTGTSYNAGTSYTPTADVTLYASWYTNYTVTFSVNSGSGTAPAAQTGSAVSSITLPSGNGLSRSGYIFGGWNTAANGSGTNYNAGASYTPTASITLYARWYNNCTITFNINGGTGTPPAVQTAPASSSITLPDGSDFSRNGYIFGGWNTAANGSGTNYNVGASYAPTANVTFYAKWSYQLTADVWDNNYANGITQSYKFYVVSGTTYYIWWNDIVDGNYIKSGNIAVGAQYSDGSWIFGGTSTTVNSGWTTPQSFEANRTGIVEIMVFTYNNGTSYRGSYGIVYSTSNTRPTPSFLIDFNVNGGNGTTPSHAITDGSSTVLPDGSGLSRSGYAFGGWNTNTSGTGTNYNAGSSYTPTSDITLYARWYSTVTFNVNGGNGTPPEPREVNAGSSIILSDGSGLSKSGYAFGGWNTNTSGTGTNYNGGSTYYPSGNIIFYAGWYSEWTVIFNGNNGSGTVPPTQTVSLGSSITLPDGSGLTRSGYTFGGWNTNNSGTGTNYNAGDSYTPTVNITLYARWYANYNVTFNVNSGTGTAPTTQSVSPGSSIILPDGSGLSRSGYDFGGWNTYSGGGGTNYEAGASYTPTASITLYARWLTRTSISFNLNGGSGTTPPTEMYLEGTIITLPDGSGFSRSSYTFGGWGTFSSSSLPTYEAGDSYTVTTSARTFYAVWYRTVTFDINGGSGPTPAPQKAWGGYIFLPRGDELVKEGYVFGGWTINESGTGTLYNSGEQYYPSGDTTFYARWFPTYTVTFNVNNGSGTVPAAQTVTVGSSIDLPSGSGLSRGSYFFGGWNTNASGTGTNYNVGTYYTPTTNITLYAKWDTTFSEDFEGTTHSFTIVNGTATNKWWVGTATSASGTKSAYISNNSGSSNAYTITASSMVHLYREITFPASTVPFTLSFEWKAQGEGTTYPFDYLRVVLVETSTSITANSQLSGTTLGTYNLGGTGWNQASISIPASNSGTTKRLVFTWVNDTSDGTQPPAAVDNIVLRSN